MSAKEEFFRVDRYALIGGGEGRRFPKQTHKYLEEAGKTVYAVDLSEAPPDEQDGLIARLPDDAEAAIVEVPKERTASVAKALLDRGITNIWLHQMTETEDAIALCRSRGAEVQSGSCAVMYLAPTASPHAVHRAIWKLIGRY